MVLLIIIPFLNGYFIGNINPTFSDIPIWLLLDEFGWPEFDPSPGAARPGTSPSTLGAEGSAEALAEALLDALAMACRAVKWSNRMIQYGVSYNVLQYDHQYISIYIYVYIYICICILKLNNYIKIIKHTRMACLKISVSLIQHGNGNCRSTHSSTWFTRKSRSIISMIPKVYCNSTSGAIGWSSVFP